MNFLYSDFIGQLDPTHLLLKLAAKIPWQIFEDEINQLYCGAGRLAKRVRLMVGLLILKQFENLSDERVVEAWGQNPYFQAFCGEIHFRGNFPVIPPNSSIKSGQTNIKSTACTSPICRASAKAKPTKNMNTDAPLTLL